MLFAFYSNLNGRQLAASFLGNDYYFNASLWLVASNVSKHRLKMPFYAYNNHPNLGLLGLGFQVKLNVLTMLCFNQLITSFHLVYYNHESISTIGTFFNNVNHCSQALSFHFLMSYTILLALPQLPSPLLSITLTLILTSLVSLPTSYVLT